MVSKSTQEIVVQELRNGTGSYQFDYMVNAVRLGLEKFQVIRNRGAVHGFIDPVPMESDNAAPAAVESNSQGSENQSREEKNE